MSTKLSTGWIPAAAFVAALAGGFLGVSVGRSRSAVTPGNSELAGSLDSAEIVAAVEELRVELRAARVGSPLQAPDDGPDRHAVEPRPGEPSAELSVLLEQLRDIVEAGRTIADPPPVAAFRAAAATDVEAVRAACAPGVQDPGQTFRDVVEELRYRPYQEALQRFGRPHGVDESGRWLWHARWGGTSEGLGQHPAGLRLTVSGGAVVHVEWLPR